MLPQGVWRDVAVLRQAVQYVEAALNLRRKEDWYRVSTMQLSELRVRHLFLKNDGIIGVLRLVYSEFPWDEKLVTAGRVRHQERQEQVQS